MNEDGVRLVQGQYLEIDTKIGEFIIALPKAGPLNSDDAFQLDVNRDELNRITQITISVGDEPLPF